MFRDLLGKDLRKLKECDENLLYLAECDPSRIGEGKKPEKKGKEKMRKIRSASGRTSSQGNRRQVVLRHFVNYNEAPFNRDYFFLK